jgi:flagellar basal body P-ring protein FlgI
MTQARRTILILTAVLAVTGAARAERIKDICDVQGVRSNPLWG